MTEENTTGQTAAVETPTANWADSITVEHSTPAPVDTPDPATNPDTPDDADTPPPVKRKPTGYLRKLGRAEAERDMMAAEIERLKAQIAPAKPEAAASDEPTEPELDDFSSYAEYQAALRKFDREEVTRAADKLVKEELGKRDAEAKKNQEAGQFQSTVQKKAQDYTAKLTEYEAANPGTQAKIKEAEEAGLFPDHLVLMTLSSQDPLAVTTHLANNIDELQAISQMNPQQAQLALARLEGRLEATEKAAPVARQTQANPPIKPAKTGSSGSTKSPHEMSLSELDGRWKPLS